MVRGPPFRNSPSGMTRYKNDLDEQYQPQLLQNEIFDTAINDLKKVIADRERNGETQLHFALMVSDGSDMNVVTSDTLQPLQSQLFSDSFKEYFLQGLRRQLGPPDMVDHRYSHRNGYYDPASHQGRRSSAHCGDDSSSENDGTVGRKRSRHYSTIKEEESMTRMEISHRRQFCLGDHESVESYFIQRLKGIQQTACKVIAKAFIKVIEPKKQTHYPYTKQAQAAPKWWPPLPLPGEKGPNVPSKGVRHKEPDHLYKDERIRLIVCIFWAVLDRSPHINNNKPMKITIRDLEKATNDSMETQFFRDTSPDKNSEKNKTKKPLLRELFMVAKQVERYKDGGLDREAVVSVLAGDNLTLDDEPEEGCDDEDDYRNIPTPPESVISPQTSQPMEMATQQVDQDYSLPMHQRYIPLEEPRYPDMQLQQPFGSFSPNVEDPNRRWPQNFAAPSNAFTTWTAPPATTMAGQPISYTQFAPPASNLHPPLLNLPPPHGQLHPQFDRMRPAHGMHTVLPQHTFPDYMPQQHPFSQGPVNPEMKNNQHMPQQSPHC